MRIALLVHGLPPRERTGVETHVAALARSLGHLGQDVRVLAGCRDPERAHLSERRERRDGYVVDWLALNEPPRDVEQDARPPGVAEALGEWLDRERPHVVHVHHVQGFGWGALEEVAGRELPLVFSAHDYHAVCQRVTLLRPDLSRCDVVGDAQHCARCDLAVASLHGRTELGDWHMGALPEQLTDSARAALSQALGGTHEGEAWERALARRTRADALRAEALSRVDLVLAPTRYVAARLAQGGLSRVRVMPYAIETAALRGLPPVAADDARPLRVGFVGGMAKHKGAHVLIEAARGLAGIELHLFGDSSDRPYVAATRARASEVGVHWHGAFAAADLPAVLGGLDVVAVPSLWHENAPFVIREAFAAGRPVLASRVGALPESVRDGVDGLLLEPGEPDAWRAALVSLERERTRVRRMAAAIEAPPELEGLAGELLEVYGGLCSTPGAARAPGDLPPHLLAFQARREALSELPLEELYRRVAQGLSSLRSELDVVGDAPLPRKPGPWLERAREALRDRRREASWSRGAGAEDAHARGHLERELEWLRSVLAAREEELEWQLGQAVVRDDVHARATEELRAARAALETERDWLRDSLARQQRETDASRAQLDALARHERWLRDEARALATAVLGGGDATRAEADGALDPARLARDVELAHERARDLSEELAWRQREMARALEEGGSLLRAVVARSALGRRLDTWRAPDAEARP